MKLTKKELKKSQVELTIILNDEDVQKYRKKAIEQLSKEVKIQGFRAGHIPENILLEHIGEFALNNEIERMAIIGSLHKAFEAEKLNPLAQPKIEIKEAAPLSFTATFEVYPKVDLGKYRDVKVSVKEEKITEKEINEVMLQLQEQIPDFKDVTRAAKKDDVVEIDFEGFTTDGHPVPNTKASGYKVLLGSNQFIPGFEDNMIGLKSGEEKEFNITFPKDYQAKEMAGNTYKFKVKVHLVQEKKLPEVNEEFVERITGKKDSVESLKNEIKKNLEIKKYRDLRAKAEEELLEALDKKASIEVPEVLIKEEEDFLIDNIKMGGLQQGLPWEKYLEAIKKTEEELRKEVKEEAEKRVRYRLIIQEIIKQENISADETEIEGRAAHAFSHLKAEQQSKLKDSYLKGGQHYEQIRNMALVEVVFNSFLGKPKRDEHEQCDHSHDHDLEDAGHVHGAHCKH